MKLRAVGFDIDGTIYPDSQGRRHSVVYFLRNFRAVMAFSRTRKYMRASGNLDPQMELSILAKELRVNRETAQDIRDNILHKGWAECFRNIKTYPGVRTSLLKLREAGLKIAALSDIPVGRRLEYLGLSDLFDVTLGFPDSGFLKPNPEPFILMADKLGVYPEACIYVGNKPEYDVVGARNVGMRGILIDPSRSRRKNIETYPGFPELTERILYEVASK